MKLITLLFVDDTIFISVTEDNIFTPNSTSTCNENLTSENQNYGSVGLEPVRSRIDKDNAILDRANVSHAWVVTFSTKKRKKRFQNQSISINIWTSNNILRLNLVQKA